MMLMMIGLHTDAFLDLFLIFSKMQINVKSILEKDRLYVSLLHMLGGQQTADGSRTSVVSLPLLALLVHRSSITMVENHQQSLILQQCERRKPPLLENERR